MPALHRRPSPDPRRPRFASAARAGLLVGLGLASAAGCHTSNQRAPEVDSVPIAEMELGQVQSCFLCGDVYLGSLPDEAALDLAARRGIRTLIDVTPPGFEPDFSIEAAARVGGFTYLRIPVQPEGATDLQVDAVLSVLSNPERGLSFLFGVTSGPPALLMGIYRSHYGDVELEQAIQDALRVGMEPGASVEVFREQVERLERGAGSALAESPDQIEPAASAKSSMASATRAAS